MLGEGTNCCRDAPPQIFALVASASLVEPWWVLSSEIAFFWTFYVLGSYYACVETVFSRYILIFNNHKPRKRKKKEKKGEGGGGDLKYIFSVFEQWRRRLKLEKVRKRIKMAYHSAATHPRKPPRLFLILTLTALICSGNITMKINALENTAATSPLSSRSYENPLTKSSAVRNTTLENITRMTASEYTDDDFYSSTPESGETKETNASPPIDLMEQAVTALTQTNIPECLSANGRLELDIAHEVDVSYMQTKSGAENGQGETLSCLVYTTVPHDMVLHVQFVDMDLGCNNENFVHVYDGQEHLYYRNFRVDGCEVINDVYSTMNVAYFDIRIGNREVDFSIHLKLTAAPSTAKPELELEFSSPDQGKQPSTLFFFFFFSFFFSLFFFFFPLLFFSKRFLPKCFRIFIFLYFFSAPVTLVLLSAPSQPFCFTARLQVNAVWLGRQKEKEMKKNRARSVVHDRVSS